MTGPISSTRGLARIGIVVPVSNTNVEPDMTMLAPRGVSIHIVRSGGYDVDQVPDEKQMRQYSDTPIDEVIERILPARPHVVLYACTSATLAQGPAYDLTFRRKIEDLSGVPAVTAAGAVVEAMDTLGVVRFAFASPYVRSLNDLAIEFLESSGRRCVGRFDVPLPLGNDEVAAVSPQEVTEFAVRADCPDAEAIVLSCTDLRAAEAIEEIEKRLGKPVITSNQALLYAGLRRLGLSCAASPLAGHRLSRAHSSGATLTA